MNLSHSLYRLQSQWQWFRKHIWTSLRNRAIFMTVFYQFLNAIAIVLRMANLITLQTQIVVTLLGVGIQYWFGLRPLMKEVDQLNDKTEKPGIPHTPLDTTFDTNSGLN